MGYNFSGTTSTNDPNTQRSTPSTGNKESQKDKKEKRKGDQSKGPHKDKQDKKTDKGKTPRPDAAGADAKSQQSKTESPPKKSRDSEENRLVATAPDGNALKYKESVSELFKDQPRTINEFMFPLRYLEFKGDITLRHEDNKVVAVGNKSADKPCIIHCHDDHRKWQNKPENLEAARTCITQHESKEVKMLRRGVAALKQEATKLKKVFDSSKDKKKKDSEKK
jgi:hypothetical protein